VRGYALAGQGDFLTPYTSGLAIQRDAVNQLGGLLADLPAAAADLKLVLSRADGWRSVYAQPTIDKVNATKAPVAGSAADVGKASFDSLRGAVGTLQHDLGLARQQATTALNGAAGRVNTVCLILGVALVLIVLALALGLRAAAIRPLTRLAGDVASGRGRRFRACRRTHRPARGPRAELARQRNARTHPARAVLGAGRALGARRPHAGSATLQRRTGAVRLRRIARPAGTAAQGGQLLRTAATPLRRPAGRTCRPVHRFSRWTAPSGCRF